MRSPPPTHLHEAGLELVGRDLPRVVRVKVLERTHDVLLFEQLVLAQGRGEELVVVDGAVGIAVDQRDELLEVLLAQLGALFPQRDVQLLGGDRAAVVAVDGLRAENVEQERG